MEKRRKQIRLRHFDYGNTGAYYVTICTNERKRFLSRIDGENVHLTKFGIVVQEELLRTMEMRPTITLGDYVIMPNHIHLVIFFHERAGTPLNDVQEKSGRNFGRTHSGSLSTVIGSFKSSVTSRIKKENGKSKAVIWQRGFYEHIIRDEKDLMRITDYILSNPINWAIDEENPERISTTTNAKS